MADDDKKKPPTTLKDVEDLIDEVPREILQASLKRRGAVSVLVAEHESRSFSGPLPPPEYLEQYERIEPGFASRIVGMAEDEQRHRHEAQSEAVTGSMKIQSRGQWFAFVLSLTIVAGSIFLIDRGHEISGSILAGSTLIGLAYVFITGRRKAKESDSNGESSDA